MLLKIECGSSLCYLLLDKINPCKYSSVRPRVTRPIGGWATPVYWGQWITTPHCYNFGTQCGAWPLWVAGAYWADEPFPLNTIQHQPTSLTTSERWWLSAITCKKTLSGEEWRGRPEASLYSHNIWLKACSQSWWFMNISCLWVSWP